MIYFYRTIKFKNWHVLSVKAWSKTMTKNNFLQKCSSFCLLVYNFWYNLLISQHIDIFYTILQTHTFQKALILH